MTFPGITPAAHRRVLLLALLVCAAFLYATTAAAQGSGAQTQLKETVDQIVATLGDKGLDDTARRSKISGLIRERFDFRTMAQMTLATNWKAATDAQRERFIDLFSQLLEATYMGRIEAYTDEKVHFVGEKLKGDKAMVDTRIATKTVEIPIDYKLVLQGSEWLVYDVVIEQVSLVRSYRTNYGDIVQKEGMDGLLVRMEQKLTEIRNTPAAAKTS